MLVYRLFWRHRDAAFYQGKRRLFFGLMVLLGLLIAYGTDVLLSIIPSSVPVGDFGVFLCLVDLGLILQWFAWKAIRKLVINE